MKIQASRAASKCLPAFFFSLSLLALLAGLLAPFTASAQVIFTGATRTPSTAHTPGSLGPQGTVADKSGKIVSMNGSRSRLEVQEGTDAAPVSSSQQSVNFGTQAVAFDSSTQTLNFFVDATPGEPYPASVAVLTNGAPNQDFQISLTGDECAPNTTIGPCSWNVKFAPKFSGARNGAFLIYGTDGSVLISVPLYGVGTGPQIAYNPGTAISIAPGLSVDFGVAVDGAGDVYVADQNNNRVVEVPAGGGPYVYISPTVNGDPLTGPQGLAVDGAGDLFIADEYSRIIEVPAGGGAAFQVPINGQSLQGPEGIAVDGAGDLFIADFDNSRIVEAPADGSAAIVIDPSVNGQSLLLPENVTVDGAGDVFIADTFHNRVLEVPAGGGAATAVAVSSNVASLLNPYGLAVDGAGNLYISDAHSRIVEVPAGGGPAMAFTAGLGQPSQIALDGAGDLFIADLQHNRVVELQRSTPPTEAFTSPTNGGSTDTTDGTNGTETVTVQNIGNLPLYFYAINYATDFPEEPGAPSTDCSTSAGVAAGSICTLSIDFSPQLASATGETTSLSESVGLIDTSLNASPGEQSVPVTGTEALSATSFQFSYVPYGVQSGAQFSMVITADNALKQADTSYNGTVHFTSTDPAATLPPDTTFTNGTATVYATLVTLGSQTIMATDTVNNSLAGATPFNVQGTAPVITSNPQSESVFTSQTATFTAAATGSPTPAVQWFVSTDGGNSWNSVSGGTNTTLSFAASFAMNGNLYEAVFSNGAGSPATTTAATLTIQPANLVVTTNSDDAGNSGNCTAQAASGTGTDAACSLRDALAFASSAGASSITFDGTAFASSNSLAQRTITLGSAGTLTIPGNVTITGPTTGSGSALANLVAVDGAATYQVFNIPTGTVAISNLTIQNGSYLSTDVGNGAGVENSGTLTLTNDIFTGNSVGRWGGAVYSTGPITIIGTTIMNNSAKEQGGAMQIQGTTATITNSTITGNTAFDGGGMYVYNANVTVNGSTFASNHATFSTNDVYNFGTLAIANTVIGDLNNVYSPIDNGGNVLGNTNLNLAPLGNYGGPTQTMIPLPGSTPICAGTAANWTAVGVDQRGGTTSDPNCASGTVDAGAVQTKYAMTFAGNEPGGTQTTGIAFSAGVTLTESGQGVSGVSIPVTLNGGTLSGSPVSAQTDSNGLASYSLTATTTTPLSNLTLTATLPAPPTLTATSSDFILNPVEYVLSAVSNPSGAGTIGLDLTNSAGLPAGSYVPSTVVTLTANPAAGYVFSSWSGSADLSSTSANPTTITMNSAAENVTANYTVVYPLTISANPSIGGTVSPASEAYYAPGTSVPITATPNSGFTFGGWTGSSDIVDSSNPSTTITMNGSENVSAVFIENFVVTNLSDEGFGSLRDAINDANGAATGGNITFAPGLTGTISLNSTLPTITGAVTITGPGAANLTISGNNAVGVMEANNHDGVTVSGVTIANGNSGEGGGIFVIGGNFTLKNSTLSGNTGTEGGAIADITGDSMTIINSTISGNSASLGGAAFVGAHDNLTLINSTISGNTSSSSSGAVNINGSSTFTAVNSTISNNQNGGINDFYGGAVNLANSVVSGNQTNDISGSYNDNGGNVVSNASINLAPLSNYGGPTQTMIPLPGSPAICAGLSSNLNGLTTDQRGGALDPDCPANSVDAGAVQSNYALSFTVGPPSSSFVNEAMRPSPRVTLMESGNLAGFAPSVLGMTDSQSVLSGTETATTAAGVAIFGNLSTSAAASGDQLTATLSLNPALATPLNLSVQSGSFDSSAGTMAKLTSPTPSSTLTSSTAAFAWSGGEGVQDYELLVGTTGIGSANVYNSGPTLETSQNVTVPTQEDTLYVRFRQMIGGAWTQTDYTYTEFGAPTAAAITSPAPGTTLTTSNPTFVWTGGVGVQDYVLLVGTTGAGSYNVYSSSVYPGTTTSQAVSVPSIGATLYVRLRQRLNGAWQQTDYTYTELGSPTPATITTPAANSTLSGANVTFTWTGGVGVQDYELLIGTTQVGSSNIYNSNVVTVTSENVTVPAVGAPIYVRLRQRINGLWQQADYVYTEAGTPTPATITSPTAGSTLTSASVTFTWTGGVGVQDYVLLVGTTGAGSSNVYDSGVTMATSETVTVPTTGATLYVRLRQRISGAWQQQDYTYIEQ